MSQTAGCQHLLVDTQLDPQANQCSCQEFVSGFGPTAGHLCQAAFTCKETARVDKDVHQDNMPKAQAPVSPISFYDKCIMLLSMLVRGAAYGQGMGALKSPTRNSRLLHRHQSPQRETLQYRCCNQICVCTILTSRKLER